MFRAYDDANDRPVVLKVLWDAEAPPEKRALFRREFRLLRDFAVDGVVAAHRLDSDQSREVLVLEDAGGASLASLLLEGELPVGEALRIGAGVARVLAAMHAAQLVHKDINPSNVVYNRANGDLRVIDLGIASQLSAETAPMQAPAELEGTLPYLSPEQTGRTNRSIDSRSDLYSLGVTLYELLTGRRPFDSPDPLAVVHAHLAVRPPPAHEHRPAVPEAVSAVVDRLLAKDPEQRYQSATGVAADLEACLSEWDATGSVAPFRLGARDVRAHFKIPEQLFGREPEVDVLLDSFERARVGRAETVWVSGHGGVGKSALVRELATPIAERRGYFGSGKFDQVLRDTPYSGIAAAFGSLIRQLLTESADELELWRAKLQAACGPNAGVMIELIPELEAFLGSHPVDVEMPAHAAGNRMNGVFRRVVEIFARPEHPLVLFLDDVQWADLGSISLLRHLMTLEIRHLLLIAAHREAEVGPDHPLTAAADAIAESGRPFHRLRLEALTVEHVARLAGAALGSEVERVRPLAELVHGKTGGNPYFVREFLQALHASGQLRFEAESGSWTWDTAQVQARTVAENVVELMTDKLMSLDERSRSVLADAACVGSPFDLGTLAFVRDSRPSQVAEELWAALSAGLVRPRDASYKLVESGVEDLDELSAIHFEFAHDRVQEAAYALVPEDRRRAHHRRIGERLLRMASNEAREDRLFEIVNHLNIGRSLITSSEDRLELSDLNLRAGIRAKNGAAHGAANELLRVGLGLLGDDPWSLDYERALALHDHAAEAAFLVHDGGGGAADRIGPGQRPLAPGQGVRNRGSCAGPARVG